MRVYMRGRGAADTHLGCAGCAGRAGVQRGRTTAQPKPQEADTKEEARLGSYLKALTN